MTYVRPFVSLMGCRGWSCVESRAWVSGYSNVVPLVCWRRDVSGLPISVSLGPNSVSHKNSTTRGRKLFRLVEIQ